MFDMLFTRYKNEVIEDSISTAFKELGACEKILIAILLLFAICASVSSLLNCNTLIVIFLSFMLLGVFVLAIFYGRGEEKKRKMIIMERKTCRRTQKLVALLGEFKINVGDNREMEKLIECSNKELSSYYTPRGLGEGIKPFLVYFVVPLIAVLISEYLQDANETQLFVRALIITLIAFAIVLLIISFSMFASLIFSKNKYYLEGFIMDMEEIMTFQRKTQELISMKME